MSIGDKEIGLEFLKKGLDYHYGHGNPLGINIKESINCLLKAKSLGIVSARVFLAECEKNGEYVTTNIENAQRLCQEALELNIIQEANDGDQFSQIAVGHIYYWGYGVEENVQIALNYYRLASNQDNPIAQLFHGLLIIQIDQEGTESYNRSIELFTKSAEQNHAPAQLLLAELCSDEDNINDSIKWYQKAANQGHSKALTMLKEK
eukprot:c21386_g1_i1.p1 GENE.c21386_g1_i1~~c21386_g1_i1.p1  ORF type:complete len:206 (+),score=79.25 c21386_g1_i1:54-671(+)